MLSRLKAAAARLQARASRRQPTPAQLEMLLAGFAALVVSVLLLFHFIPEERQWWESWWFAVAGYAMLLLPTWQILRFGDKALRATDSHDRELLESLASHDGLIVTAITTLIGYALIVASGSSGGVLKIAATAIVLLIMFYMRRQARMRIASFTSSTAESAAEQ